MTLSEVLILIPVLTTATIAVITATKAPRSRAQIDATHTRVSVLGEQINGRLADLLDATRLAAFNAGLLEGERLHRAGARLPTYDATAHPGAGGGE